MTPEQFTYWLQGYSEVCGDTPTDEQWWMIQDHLRLVFQKETPSCPPDKFPFDQHDFQIPRSPTCDNSKTFCALSEEDLQTINRRLRELGL